MTIESLAAEGQDAPVDRPAQFRYGIVFGLLLALVVFVVAAPAADWSRAVAMTMGGAALVVAVATARERRQLRYRKALGVTAVLVVVIAGVAVGALSQHLIAAVNVVVIAAIPVIIGRGVVRVLRRRGVTVQAVAGALAIYLAVGLMFAWIVGFISHVDATPYFSEGTDGTVGDQVYFSFAVLTTTGFGDFTAATPAGHALAVVEMLTGQIYLVTVIGLLIGNFAARPGP